MLDTTARYVYEVYRLKSVSEAAKALYISQPALSAAIRKAETALGAPIFNRKTLPFTLTAEGKVYIDGIENMLKIEQQTQEKLQDMREMRGGTLRIGTASHLSYFVLPKILEVFHRECAGVDVQIVMTTSDKLMGVLENNTVDMVLLPLGAAPSGYTAIPLFEERYVVAMTSHTAGADALKPWAVTHDDLVNGQYGEEQRITDMSVFHDFEFVYCPPHTTIYKKRKLLLGNIDTSYVVSNSGQQQLNYNLMQAGLGALLTTDADIATMPPSDCLFFVLGGAAATGQYGIVRPDTPTALSPIVDRFTAIATALFRQENPLIVLQ